MTFETDADASGTLIELIERTHEFTVNELGIDPSDVLVTGEESDAGHTVTIAVYDDIGSF